MYAIIEVGSKQYVVKEKDIIEVDRNDYKAGKEFSLGKVLLVKDGKTVEVGQPYLKDCKVHAKLLKDFRGEKLFSFKYRRRKNSSWKKGHRQNLSQVEIVKISTEKEKAEKETKEEKPKIKKDKS